MSSVLPAMASAATVERKKRARRQAANSFLSSISLGSNDAVGAVSAAVLATTKLILETETEGGGLDDPPLAPPGWADPEASTASLQDVRSPDSTSVVPHKKEKLDVASSLSPESATATLTDIPISPARSLPLNIPTNATASNNDNVFSPSSLGGNAPFSLSNGLMSSGDRGSIIGRNRAGSLGRSPYVHLDSINGLRGTPSPRLLLTMPPASDRPGTPFALLSYIGFQQTKVLPPARVPLQPLSDSAVQDAGRTVSREAMFRVSESDAATYDPLLLDESALRTSKHHQVINLPSILGSIIRYTRPNDLKKTLNEKFRQAHPDLDPSMSLSKLQKMKECLVEIGEQLELEAHSIACAFVLFERLVLKNVVHKANRRAKAAACLLLAVKMGDMKETPSVALPKVVAACEKHLETSVAEINKVEFTVFEELEFDVNVTTEAAMPHLLRILTVLDYSGLPEYLGPAAYTLFHNK